MALRIVQIICIVITAAILYGLNAATDGLGRLLGYDFNSGFLVGAGFMVLLYLAICWIDPSSRPRGTGGKQQSFDDRAR